MTKADKITKKIEQMNFRSSVAMRDRILSEASQAMEQTINTSARKPSVGRMIMKSRITRLTVAAILLVAVYMGLHIPSTAYALQDTIKAYNSVRWLHALMDDYISKNRTRTTEAWFECDQQGNIIKARQQTNIFSKFLGDASIIVIGQDSDLWLPKQNLRVLGKGNPNSIMPFKVSELDPKLLIENLHAQQTAGLINVDIDQPKQKSEPITVTVTYPENTRSEKIQKVFHIDQATKLLIGIDKYELRKDELYLYQSMEFFDYNLPIDQMMFTLDDEVPADAKVSDLTDEQMGVPIGNMTREEVANEVIRQFFQAIIDKDYFRAGLMWEGTPPAIFANIVEKATSNFEQIEIIEIRSIGKATPVSDPDSNTMRSSCNVLLDDNGRLYELPVHKMLVKPLSFQQDRWVICDTANRFRPLGGALTITPDQTDLGAATYDGLVSGEFMQKWLILGPIPIQVPANQDLPSEETQVADFAIDHIDTAQFTPAVTINQDQYTWSALECERGVIRFSNKYKQHDYHTIYAWSQINMPEEKQTTLAIGSDDGVKVWLNGELVHENWDHRGAYYDNDKFPVTFKKGVNHLVLKIQNGDQYWGMVARILDQ